MSYEQMKKILETLDNPADKLEMVMDFGMHMPTVPNGAHCDEIKGCSSRVEICRFDGKLYGRADSAIVRGVVALLLAMVEGKTPNQIKEMDLLKEFSSLNLVLGAARLSGLNSMVSFLQNL